MMMLVYLYIEGYNNVSFNAISSKDNKTLFGKYYRASSCSLQRFFHESLVFIILQKLCHRCL
jgi:hypothetical protein